MKDQLDNNKTDLLVSAAKSAVGVVPIAGSLLSELVGNLIPNQRIDRLSKYVKELDDRISKIPTEKINSLLNNDDFIDLIEEGFVQASRAITDKRRQYIASIVSTGITDKNIQLNESKQLLKILSELNDIEIIWLRSYLVPTIGGDEEFRQKHKNILQPIHTYMGADEETMTKAALQNSYKEHLERLELIDHKIRIDTTTKMPEFDTFTGKPKKSYSTITTLGRLLLKQIGIIDELNQR
ncbi:hypothetical protein ACTS9T_15580 [Empedobacter falsenii]